MPCQRIIFRVFQSIQRIKVTRKLCDEDELVSQLFLYKSLP
jgi:hypothetical protein